MRQTALSVAEVATVAGHVHVRCGGPLPCAPGQFYLARAEAAAQPFLRIPIYPYTTRNESAEFYVEAGHPYAALAPGTPLDVIGPCGGGFDLPSRAAHLLVMVGSPCRLLPLIYAALERHFAVTALVASSVPLPDLPLAVEVLRERGPLTVELAAWADVVGLDLPDPFERAWQIRTLRQTRHAEFIQALLTPPMPCGTGACQACWVETGRGRKLACVDGPVFWL
ncbi:MAG: hypothetical protein ACRDH2_01525 [Anaerolineales bacterium]